MSRVFWFTAGAVTGIMVYRNGRKWMATVQQQGLLETGRRAAATTVSVVGTARAVVVGAGVVGGPAGTPR